MFLACLLLISCGSQAPEVVPSTPEKATFLAEITPAVQQRSAQQSLEETQRKSTEAEIKAAVAEVKVAESREQLADYQVRVQSLAATVDQLRAQEKTTADQWSSLAMEIEQQDAYIESLSNKLAEASTALEERKVLREKMEESLRLSSALAAAKEAEADQLRAQLEDQKEIARNALAIEHNKYLVAKNDVDRISREKADLQTDFDRAEGSKDLWFRILIATGITAVISILINVIQFKTGALPRIPFL